MKRTINLEDKLPIDKNYLATLIVPPTKPRPGWDYYWEPEKGEWVQVQDNDDMTWWQARYFGFKPQKGDVWPENMRLTGKQWKELFVSPMKDKPISASHIIL